MHFKPKVKRFLLVFTLSILVVVVALSYWHGVTVAHASEFSFESPVTVTPRSDFHPSDSSWTGIFSGNAGNQPDFSATYSGSFSFTVGNDNNLYGSGTISKKYDWSGCGHDTLTGYLAVKGYVDASKMVYFYFSVSQPSNDVQIANCGTVFGATDGFDGLQVTMPLVAGQPSDPIKQLGSGYPDYVQITLQGAAPTSNQPGTLQVNILDCPSTVKSGDVVQLSGRVTATSPPDFALPKPDLKYYWQAQAGTFGSLFSPDTTWSPPSVDSETRVTVTVQVSASNYGSASDSCIITVQPASGGTPSNPLWGGLVAGGSAATGVYLATKPRKPDENGYLTYSSGLLANQVAQCIKSQLALPSREDWCSRSPKEKEQLLEVFEKTLEGCLGLPGSLISFTDQPWKLGHSEQIEKIEKNMEYGEWGPWDLNSRFASPIEWVLNQFSDGAMIINMNKDACGNNFGKALDTVIHETMHQYQYGVVHNTLAAGDPRDSTYAKLLDYNFNNFIDPRMDLEGYRQQFHEREARAFADAVRQLLKLPPPGPC